MHGSWYATNGPAKLFTETVDDIILFSKLSNTTPKYLTLNIAMLTSNSSECVRGFWTPAKYAILILRDECAG
jgi:hypothetical protein